MRNVPVVRRIGLSLAVAALVFGACARRPGGSSGSDGKTLVAFASMSFGDALDRARAENRLVMVDVYTDWCGWCKKLDREVFSDGKVAEAAKGLVAVRVNAEKGGEEVARRYSVQGFPTILFVDGSGSVVRRIDGYVDATEMLRIISALPKA